MSEQELRIECGDGFALAATLYGAGGTRGAVAIAAALGVPRRFYAPFARFLAEEGFAVLCFDYRGIGDSRPTPCPGAGTRLADWGRLDIEAVLRHLQARSPSRPLFLVGHSCGGQLPGLAPMSEQLSGMVFVAASLAQASLWPFPASLGLRVLWHGLIPLLSLGRDQFPARRLGLGSADVPAGVMAEWARWARRPGYLFHPAHDLDCTRYARLALPILGYGFDDDGYASPASVDALLLRYPAAAVTRRQVGRGQGRIGHFGFFRERMRDTLWPETADWLKGVAAGAA